MLIKLDNWFIKAHFFLFPSNREVNEHVALCRSCSALYAGSPDLSGSLREAQRRARERLATPEVP